MKKIFTSICFIAALAISSNAQTVIISTGTAGTPAYNAGPVYRSAAASAFDASRYTYLYTASELAAAGITSGSVINLVGWVKNNTATSLGVGGIFRIYMKNTSAASFSLASETWTNLNTGAIMVYENLTQTIPATATPNYIDFPLTTSFTYTGGSLEISTEWDINQVAGNASTGTFDWLWSTVVDRIYGTGNTTLAPITTLSSTTNSISTIDDRRPFIKITYTGGTTGIDVGAQSLVAPAVSANNCYTSAEPVTIRIRNFSTNPIDFSVDPMTVTTNVTGAATQTLTGTVNTGTLAPAATLDVPMSATLNMSATGVYTFNAFTTVAGDVTPGNNAMTAVNITKAVLAPGTASATPGSYCVTPGAPTLSTTGATGYGSLQWQQSTTPAVGFTNIPGATTSPFTLAGPITQTMYYRLIASCNGNNVTSNETSVTLNNPQITGTTPGASCGPGPVTVTLAATGTGTTFNWYAAPSGGLPIGTGSPFTTPAISSNTNYYVSASSGGGTANLGLPARLATATSGAGTTNFGLVFDALTPFTLNSVVVYPVASAAGTAGTVTIDVINSAGTVLNTATVNVVGNPAASATAQTVTLNFNIAAGTNLKLRPGARSAGITGLLFEPSAAAPAGNYGYPFVIPGVVSVNHSTLTAAPANTARLDLYYYFYNWSIATGCESARTAVLASITTPPSATITYAGSPYCANAGTATVTQTGTAGGTYSSTAGLTINSGTGAVTLGTSTPGTYTVTYTVAASGGCPVYTTTSSITITALPAATISYAGTPYCSNAGTATVTQTGTAGGTYSSTAGLTINAATGDVTLGTSTPGTYTVTYTVAAAGGCALFTTTTSITITAVPVATIAYTSSPYCTVGGTATVTQTGTAGGTYSSTAGLTINAATGDVTLSTSTPATYTVTYTIAASGGCSVFTATTSITVINCLFPCVETFDAVTAPALPISWSATVGATCVNTARWVTVNTTSSSAPNSASVNDPNCISDEYLDSRIFNVSATPSVLTFRNSYDLEASTVTPTLGFDGMVLEISINGGGFTDIITAGGSFVAGGYNRTISGGFSSPIANRQAWSGNSGGFITTTVNLPITALGQNVVFRWRRASDSSVGASGANIDDVSVTTTATIAYTGSPYCSNAGTATVTRTGAAGGTYSSTAGLTLNATTGDVTLGTSTPGTYTVTYTIAASGGCPAFTTTASITINAAPAATISYAGNPYCQNAGTATVTQTGTAGGTYSSTAGLTLNAATGAVTLGTSTPGTYTVTYTIAAAGPCAAFTTTTSITVTALPAATINYAGSPYCSNAGTATVTRTGTAGGTYTAAPAGLTINATTGDVTLATSTAGTYTVTYTIAASGGCPAVTATATITIAAANAATISYAGSPYCSTVTSAPVTRTGTAGGTYTAAPAGLTINASTGTVTPNTSTPGTYTVSYTMAANGPCPALTVTTSITINAAPNMIIFYAGTPYCSNAGTANVTRFGTAGGTYSAAPAGLSINTTTGAVNLAASTAGTYIVTYSVTVAGCGITNTTTTITITAAPNATINYAGSPYCSNAGTANVTFTGTAGGTYTASPAGLSINATTGAVNLAASTAGTYTVTYTVAGSGGCATYTTTATITITALPAATIAYTGSPYCSNAGTATVTRTGTAGGTYTAAAGLSINAATGAVNLAASTPGTYTVTYTVAAGGGCPAVATTASITITALPAATITYAGSPYCQPGGTGTVTRTGTAGGTYSAAPAGLVINATTGDINIATSTAGTYTVTYTLAAGGGCGAVTATTSVTINSPSVAATAATATATSLCGPGSVTLGITGGTLGSGATWRWYTGSCGGTLVGTGATLNVTVATTTTYFVRAEGTCNTTTCASVTVTVNAQPTISIAAAPRTTLLPGQTTTLTATVTPAAGNTITWYRNGNVVPGATGLTLIVTVSDLGTYTARVTTGAGCTALSNDVTIIAESASIVFVYPNPSRGQFQVRVYNQPGKQLSVLVHNARGQLVYEQRKITSAPYTRMDVDLRSASAGQYTVTVVDSDGEVLGSKPIIIYH